MKNLKILILILMFVLVMKTANSQLYNEFTKQMDVKIITNYYDKSTTFLKEFIYSKNRTIIKLDETGYEFYIDFYLTDEDFNELESKLSQIGFVENKTIKTSNNNIEIQKNESEIKYQQELKKEIEKELNSLTTKDERYYRYWDQLRDIDKEIHEIELQIAELKGYDKCRVVISIYDQSVDLTERVVNWVNMPGVSADYLKIETAVPDISAKEYMGYQLKYMFTRGKSYANIGAYKEFSTEINDSTRFSELFLVGFGQDFYSKYLGRGKRTFLNLYTGYNIGAIFATGDAKKATFGYLTPFCGIELVKTKFILLDNRVGYLVPFKFNRNLRGLTYSISFNFAF